MKKSEPIANRLRVRIFAFLLRRKRLLQTKACGFLIARIAAQFPRFSSSIRSLQHKSPPEGVPSIKQVLPAEKTKGVRTVLFVLLFTRLARKV